MSRPADLLRSVSLFAALDRLTLAKLAAHLEPVQVASGTIVFREGDPPDAFYLVLRGSFGVYVSTQNDLSHTRLNTMGPGEPFGEMALLANHPRSATIRADTDGELLRLDRSRFLELVQREPGVALSIAATLSQRLRLAEARQFGRIDGATSSATAPDRRLQENQPRSPASSTRRRWRPNSATAGIGLAGLALLITWLSPPPSGLSVSGWHAVGTLMAIVPILALGVLPEGVLALALVTVWVLGGIAPPRIALGGFASASWILVVSVLTVGAAFAASGLLYRLALSALTHSRGGYAGQVFGLSLAGLVVGPAVPNATARVALMAPALTELVEALGYNLRSRAAAGLAMATLVGFGQMAAVFLTSSTTAVLVFAVLPPNIRADISWVSWAASAAPPNALLFVGLTALVAWFYRPRSDQEPARARVEALALQRALLGPASREERISLGVGLGLLIGFITQPWHRIDPAWVAVLALGVLAFTRVVTADTLRAVNWSFALLFGMLASLSEVLSSTQVDRWVARLAGGSVRGGADAPVLFIAGLVLLCFVVGLVIRWQAAAPLLTIALAPAASAAGIHPLVVGLVALMACNAFFLPYQSTTYLALYHGTGGRLFTHAQARFTAVAYALVTLLALCASVPAWRLLGLL